MLGLRLGFTKLISGISMSRPGQCVHVYAALTLVGLLDTLDAPTIWRLRGSGLDYNRAIKWAIQIQNMYQMFSEPMTLTSR